MSQLESGDTLCSRFALIRPLGRGGMGEVWLALDERLDQDVVAKIVPADASATTIELSRQECRNARRLSHPSIVRVFDFHQCDGVSFITMEHVEGDSIESLRGRSIGEIVQVLVPLAEALRHAHQAGVVHRDVKASNVLLDSAGKPRLMDFGIAGILQPGEGDLLLSGGGSKYSMSPQQLAGDPPQPADDIYGLGALAYHLVTGQPPFWPDAHEARIRGEEPAPIDSRRGGSPRLQALISAMLAKSTADRPADMVAVRKALEEVAAELSITETRAPEVRPAGVRLTPPPKIEAPRLRTGQDPDAASKSRLPLWMTVGAFAVLGARVVGVFMLLPGWVQRRGEREITAASDGTPVIEAPKGQTSQPAPRSEPSVEPEDRRHLEVQPTSTPSPSNPTPAEEQVVQSQTEAIRVEAPAKVAPSSDGEFRRLMSEGLTALAAGDAARARQAFQRALVLSPGSPEAIDGSSRADESLRLAAISEHRVRAAESEGKENWQAALEEYDSVLALDPTIRFALEGKARTETRAELAEQLQSHIAHPERLSTDEVLESAQQLLDQAESTEPSGPVLRRQIDSLAEHIAVATTPIRVELISDNLTEVTVYRVGRLGRFTQHALDLRPGSYTVVGSRAGYRDVRQRLTVSPNRDSKPVVVRCEEKI